VELNFSPMTFKWGTSICFKFLVNTRYYLMLMLIILSGAKNQSLEVVIMNGLSMNIHIGMTAFYRPTANRHKILIENE